LWDAAKAALRGKSIAINTYKKQARNIPNKQPNSTLYGTRKRRTELNISRRKEITEIRSEINEIENRKTIETVQLVPRPSSPKSVLSCLLM